MRRAFRQNLFLRFPIAWSASLLREDERLVPVIPQERCCDISDSSTRWSVSRRTIHFVLVGLLVRLVVVCFSYGEQLSEENDHYAFGWEVGRMARCVVEGHGFSSPLGGDTGPSAWLPPVFVSLLAGVFALFGVYTSSAAVAILTLNCVFSALTAIPLVLLAERIGGKRTALWTGWAWAFFPYAIFISAFRVWGETLDALLVTCLICQSVLLAESHRRNHWVTLGALAGFAALTNPNTMALIPGLWGWVVYRRRAAGMRWRMPLAAASVSLLVVVSPWFVRNYSVFGQVLPFRSNLWLEVYVGNNSETPTMLVDWNRHPASNETELAAYREWGELQYMAEKRRQSWEYIRTHPATFASLTLRRVLFVWTGFWSLAPRYLASEPLQLPFVFFSTSLSWLALRGICRLRRAGNSLLAPLVLALLLQPLIYYVTHPALEYRHAIDPILVLLASYRPLVSRAQPANFDSESLVP